MAHQPVAEGCVQPARQSPSVDSTIPAHEGLGRKVSSASLRLRALQAARRRRCALGLVARQPPAILHALATKIPRSSGRLPRVGEPLLCPLNLEHISPRFSSRARPALHATQAPPRSGRAAQIFRASFAAQGSTSSVRPAGECLRGE